MLPSLATYKGPSLPAGVLALLEALRGSGFTVAPSGRANKTIRIQHGTIYLGYVNEFVISNGGLIGYRFQLTPTKGNNACPNGFILDLFAREHGFPVSAFDIQSNGKRRFLHILDGDAALALFQGSSASAPGEASSEMAAVGLAADLAAIAADTDISATTREALIQARLGQGVFRKALLRIYSNCCAVTGIPETRILRASHIKPWKDATNEERLDPDNGILLSPNLDALFDAGLITFLHTGTVRVSRRLDFFARERLGPIADLRCPPTEKQAVYLRFHGEHVFREA